MSAGIDARACLHTHDVLFLTIDTLRYDVAAQALADGMTPNLAEVLPGGRWEKRHSPSSFTYAAHHAFFAGFLPTPASARADDPAAHRRLFAARFPGSRNIAATTLVFDAPDIVTGFAEHGYHTICIGGVGFFNKRSPLGSVLPALFEESHWYRRFGVACRDSAENQVVYAVARIASQPSTTRAFVFVNFSACHPPHAMYLAGQIGDCPASQAAALADIDRHLPRLFAAMSSRAPVLLIICSDHGAAFGEGDYFGHRLGHPVVWEVPYMHNRLPRASA